VAVVVEDTRQLSVFLEVVVAVAVLMLEAAIQAVAVAEQEPLAALLLDLLAA
jgi:hypothetical protein